MTNVIIQGDARHIPLADESVHCVVTSPPYFGLRDYGVGGQIGLEPTPQAYVNEMVAVFREVWRVLRNDGTCWVNLGDSYASGKGSCYNPGGGASSLGKSRKQAGVHPLNRGNKSALALSNLKPKDLIGIPWRVALALQADGWYLRSDIVWAKPNPMPESVKDRPTRSHEYVFLLAKSERYFFDQEAVREPANLTGKGNATVFRHGGKYTHGRSFQNHEEAPQSIPGNTLDVSGTRNLRSVWTITPKPFKGSHFATFPPELVERCIKGGCPAYGTVLDPFAGAGTTPLVAHRLGRHSIGVELNPAYCQMGERRLKEDAPLFA